MPIHAQVGFDPRVRARVLAGRQRSPRARPATPLAETATAFAFQIDRASTGVWVPQPIRIDRNGDGWSVRLEAGDATKTGTPSAVPTADAFVNVSPVRWDQWNDFVLHFKVSDGTEEGFCDVWINDSSQPAVHYSGPLGYGGDLPFLELGIHVPSWAQARPAGITVEHWLDSLRIGYADASYADVAP